MPIVIAAACVLVGTVIYLVIRNGRGDGDAIPVSGTIEATTVDVSFMLPGIVRERLVDEGDAVRAGQAVAVLEDAELLQQVALSQADVRAAEAALAELKAGSRPEEIARAEAASRQAGAVLDELLAGSRPEEVAVAKAAVDSAESRAVFVQANHQRKAGLRDAGVISAQEMEASESELIAARSALSEATERLKLLRAGPRAQDIEQARAAAAQADAALALVRAGPREEQIEQAAARAAQARAALALAETRLGYARVASPVAGVVLSKNVEPGEYVSPGTPVVTIGDLGNVWLRAYVDETDLGRLRLGALVRVRTDTYPGKRYEGRLCFIASEAEFTPKNVQTLKERVKLVYRVKIGIPNPQFELKPGMPADAWIPAESKAP